MARKFNNLRSWAARVLGENPPRSKSLIITVFGDSLHPYVRAIRLADLMQLMEPFGVNAQLTRTSAFRLAAEHWLQSRREGRSSRYALTPSGVQRVEHAYHRIYDPPEPQWDGNWTLLIPGREGGRPAARADLRRELEWAGYGHIAGRLYVHPRPDASALREVLKRLKLTEDVAVLRGRDLGSRIGSPIASFTSQCWDLYGVAADYSHFIAQYRPVLPLLSAPPDGESAFVLQTLLIHSFRRIVLHDPRLPAALLPNGWPGHAAYQLCRDIYRKTYRGVLSYLNAHLDQPRRNNLHPSAELLRRLGGLE